MLETLASVFDLLDCDSHESLRLASGRRFRELGFEHWAHASGAQPRAPFSVGNFPREWLDHYHRLGYFELDPVVAHCRQRSTPCLWGTDASTRQVGHSTRFFLEAAEFGLRVGVGLPNHGPGGQWSMLSVASDALPDRALRFDEIARLHLLATLVHEASLRLAVPAASEPVHLTQREADALRWAAEGKTGWEIGQLLGIGERTVAFHLTNAAAKLGVVGRRQAVARAIALQLITL
ncbi:MAG: LuxR family transcriptional regulator [Xanthomonadales bacterium]|nr:LuxR family transcriptional regulator [Xanthomonadales bacterium]